MRFTSLLVGLCLVAGAVLAQQGPPPPGPEVKRLAVFEGKWTGEAEMKPSAFRRMDFMFGVIGLTLLSSESL